MVYILHSQTFDRFYEDLFVITNVSFKADFLVFNKENQTTITVSFY